VATCGFSSAEALATKRLKKHKRGSVDNRFPDLHFLCPLCLLVATYGFSSAEALATKRLKKHKRGSVDKIVFLISIFCVLCAFSCPPMDSGLKRI
jgi:hypothetical protein